MLSILVSTLGTRPKELDRLLKSLDSQIYRNFEIILISQNNHNVVAELIKKYKNLNIKHGKQKIKGLSRGRNYGLRLVSGDIVIISDDDCWYPADGLLTIKNIFDTHKDIDISLTEIYDDDKKEKYKNYRDHLLCIKNRFQLMSRSSIEISYRVDRIKLLFDENFGLGARYVCCEEIDFLLRAFNNSGKILFSPVVTVFHPKKEKQRTRGQIIAKGAIYRKHYNLIVAAIVLFRDIIIKREFNFIDFMIGYFKYND